MYLLGYDVGSSSVKASLVEAGTGKCRASAFSPKAEMAIAAAKPGWAEQHPDLWWDNLKSATQEVLAASAVKPGDVKAIGISYQMHGLVCVDQDNKPLRPAIIWCDSRAVPYGEKAMRDLTPDVCLSHLLNSPGNFTASKLAWVKDKEPAPFNKIHKFMLPGDFIALRMTGEACTTASGLSEGMLWDYYEDCPAAFLMKYFGFDPSLLPTIKPTFSPQGELTRGIAEELGLCRASPSRTGPAISRTTLFRSTS